MTEPKNHRNPVTAFFRGLYAELAFSGESLRINGVGLDSLAAIVFVTLSHERIEHNCLLI